MPTTDLEILQALERQAVLLKTEIECSLLCDRRPECITAERRRLAKVAPEMVRDGEWFQLIDHTQVCPACRVYWFSQMAANELTDICGEDEE